MYTKILWISTAEWTINNIVIRRPTMKLRKDAKLSFMKIIRSSGILMAMKEERNKEKFCLRSDSRCYQSLYFGFCLHNGPTTKPTWPECLFTVNIGFLFTYLVHFVLIVLLSFFLQFFNRITAFHWYWFPFWLIFIPRP